MEGLEFERAFRGAIQYTLNSGFSEILELRPVQKKEENKSRSRHNVEGSFLCVLYFGWPNQPSSGIMIILH